MKYLALLTLTVFWSTGLTAQDQPDPCLIQAQALETEQKFTEALDLNEKFPRETPDNSALTSARIKEKPGRWNTTSPIISVRNESLKLIKK